MEKSRGETWKRLLTEEGVLKDGAIKADGKAVEFKFIGETAGGGYVLDSGGTGRVSGIDKGDWLIFYFHGKHPVYHLWDDVASISIRS
jgi:hypothetical protein